MQTMGPLPNVLQRALGGLRAQPTVGYEWPWSFRGQPQILEGLRRDWKGRTARTAAGLMGLFYGKGGRERATKEYGELLDPITQLMSYFKWAPGLGATKDVRRALQYTSPRAVTPKAVRRFQSALAHGPFEQRGTHILSRHAAGYEMPERSKIFHWAATRGLLPEMQRKMNRGGWERMQGRLSYLNRAVRTVQEQTGASLPAAMQQLEQSGLLAMPPQALAKALRLRQVQRYLGE